MSAMSDLTRQKNPALRKNQNKNVKKGPLNFIETAAPMYWTPGRENMYLLGQFTDRRSTAFFRPKWLIGSASVLIGIFHLALFSLFSSRDNEKSIGESRYLKS